MQIVGHERQREDLERAASLPAVLLRGPSGIGKWLIAHSYADARGGAAATLRDGPSVDDARAVANLYQQRTIGGHSTLSLVDLDDCSERAQNVLLKTIEEMPEWGQVILVASGRVLPTVLSRCQVIEFAPLFPHEVSEILVAQGVSPAEATTLAMVAGGSVERGLRFHDALRQKTIVMQYLDALVRHDRVALSTMMPRWTDDARDLLWRWVAEVLSDWPQVFTKEELALVHRLGVAKFYVFVDLIKRRYSVDLVAMEVWKQ